MYIESLQEFRKSGHTNKKIHGLLLVQEVQKKLCPRTGKACSNPRSTCTAPYLGPTRELVTPSAWYAPSSLADLFSIFSAHPESSVRLVAGDTGRGKLQQSLYLPANC